MRESATQSATSRCLQAIGSVPTTPILIKNLLRACEVRCGVLVLEIVGLNISAGMVNDVQYNEAAELGCLDGISSDEQCTVLAATKFGTDIEKAETADHGGSCSWFAPVRHLRASGVGRAAKKRQNKM